MKKIKGFIFAAGFVNTVEAGQKDFFKFKEVENDDTYEGLSTYVMTDNKKDMDYIVVTASTYRGTSVAITPRLDKNN